MKYVLERRKGRDCGKFVTWYELRRYDKVNKWGMLFDGETIETFSKKKDAKEYCKQNNINYLEDTSHNGCVW